MTDIGSPPTNLQLPVEGVVMSAGASAHAHHLVKMRVNPKSPPTTPITPTCPTTPAFLSVTHFGEENIMEDLQLAAELGKTLLERNRELESNIKHQQAIIEDQLQEIEYLSKQTAALREVNDSRLRIYEQLEISIQELEKNNQRLSAEGSADKRKIKSLCSNIESLEARCDELQKNLEEARAGSQTSRGRNSKRRSLILEEQNFRRSQSCENTTQEEGDEGEKEGDKVEEEEVMENECNCKTSEDRAAEELEMRTRLDELQERFKDSQNERMHEVRRREELEIQLACVTQENAVLQDQLTVLREKEVTLRSFDEELASLDDTSSGRLCRKCLGHVDDTASNSGVYDLHDSIEDTDASIESIHGECALVKLKNGGYAWGSQESLASIGQVVSHMGSGGTSPGTEASDAPHNSLLSELDTSYRILIEKYEALLEAREQQQQQQQTTEHTHLNHEETLVHPGVDDMSGPMSLVVTDDPVNTLKCQRCHTCSCNLKAGVGQSKSSEEFSEVETSSSGFSDGESRLSSKATQTLEELYPQIFEDSTPTPTVANRCLDLSSPLNPCDKRFQAAPEYKKLFQEIFSVLKKTVDEKDGQTQSLKPSKTPQAAEMPQLPSQVDITNSDDIKEPCSETSNEVESTETESKVVSSGDLKATPSGNEIKVVNSNEESTNTSKLVSSANNAIDIKQAKPAEEESSESKCPETSEDQRITHKPPRPDSLDLGGNNSSRSSSRQRRRRRHQRVRLDSLQQQQQYQGQYQYTHGNQNTNYNNQGQTNKYNKRDRDRDSQHSNYNQRQPSDEFPNLQMQTDGQEYNRTRIVYNSSRNKCEHHRRKHRDRTNNSQSQRYQQHNNQDNNVQQTSQSEYSRWQGNETESREKTTPKINYPSVEVAKLRKLEMTYAEALKTSFNRSYHNRRY